jgi:Concanavalin A-like lectin/glucanases superfamily
VKRGDLRWVMASAGALAALCGAPAAQAQSTVVALWHMDETRGTTMADAVGGDDGTLNAVDVGLPGALGTAYGFNGTSSYVSVPSSPALSPGAAPMSFSMSILVTTPPPKGSTKDYDLLRKGVASTSGGMYKLEVRHSGLLACRYAGSAGDVLVLSGRAVADGSWHSVTCARSGTGVSVTVDGTTWTKAGATGTISNSSRLVIGAKPGSDYTKGTIDEVSVSVG